MTTSCLHHRGTSKSTKILSHVDFVVFHPVSGNTNKQECIPVGCIPSAAVAVCSWGGGGILPQCMVGYTHPPGPGLDPPGQTPQPLPWPGPRDPPEDRMTDTCKNITFANFV